MIWKETQVRNSCMESFRELEESSISESEINFGKVPKEKSNKCKAVNKAGLKTDVVCLWGSYLSCLILLGWPLPPPQSLEECSTQS